MANEKRLIDANDVWHNTFVCDEVAEVRKFIENAPTVDAVPVDSILLHHILIDENGIPEVKLQFGDRTLVLRREGDPVDVVKAVHGRWKNHKCTNCGGAEPGYYDHIEDCIVYTPTAFCPNCGAKMDGGTV